MRLISPAEFAIIACVLGTCGLAGLGAVGAAIWAITRRNPGGVGE